MSGNFSVSATTRFLTDGIAHRKAVIMLRKTVDADSPFVHLAIHGDGMAAVQFRTDPGGNTNTLDFPIGKPGVWKLKLTRQGGNVIVSIAPGGPAAPRARTHRASVGQPGPGRPRRRLSQSESAQHRSVL